MTSVPDVAVCETLLNQLRSGTIACSFVQVLLRSIWHFTLPATNILQIKLFTLLFKSLGSVRFLNVFERSLFSSPTLPLFDKNTIKSVIYCCDQSWTLSIITPVFIVTWSSEIILICWFAAQETFLIIINVVLLHVFVETVMHFIFQDYLMTKSFRRTAFIWNRNLL